MTNQIRLQLTRPEFTLEVNLSLSSQGITAVYGASGSGKTSLLRCVAGLEKPNQCLIQVEGEFWQDDSIHLFVPTWKRPIGYVFQEASLFPHLSVEHNLQFGLKRVESEASQKALLKAIELLELRALLKRKPHALSVGEKQRIAIARAIATSPKLLLLDEPLASLDMARRLEILPWLETLRDELRIPMLYVTHAIEEVTRLADQVVVLELGKIAALGTPAEIFTSLNPPFQQVRSRKENTGLA